MPDLYDFLTAQDEPTAQERAQALQAALGRKRAVSTVLGLSGNKDIAKWGAGLGQEAQEGSQGLQKVQQYRLGQAMAAAKAKRDEAQQGIENALRKRQIDQGSWHPVKDAGVMIDTKTGRTRPMEFRDSDGSGGGAGGFPKLSDAQSNAYGFALRMLQNRGDMKDAGYPSGLKGRWDAAATGMDNSLVGKLMPQEAATEKGQLYYRAARDMVAARLRKESGAAISDDEWKQFGPLYTPMPYDSEATKEQKLRSLDNAIEAMVVASGPMAPELRKRMAGPAARHAGDDGGDLALGTPGGAGPASPAGMVAASAKGAAPSKPQGLRLTIGGKAYEKRADGKVYPVEG